MQAIEGVGDWFRLELPTTAQQAVIYLLNAPPFTASDLLAAPPPEAGCSTADCAPSRCEAPPAESLGGPALPHASPLPPAAATSPHGSR